MKKPRVVFVMSTNYAGSTVLGLVVASHSRAAFVGEPATLLRKADNGDWRHQRFCTTCGDDGSVCPVWSTEMVAAVRRDPDQVFVRAAEALGPHDFLVDASKNLRWMADASDRAGQVACLHITKPVEAYVASVLTRTPGSRPEFVAADWAERNAEIRDYCVRSSVPYLHIRYPDFATQLKRTLAGVGTFLGVEPEASQEEFWAHTHHYVKGNPGTASHFDKERAKAEPGVNKKLYQKNHRKIFLDEKWRELLSAAQIDEVYAMPQVIRESATLGYEHPLRTDGSPALLKVRAQTWGRGVEVARVLARRAREMTGR